MAEPPIVFLHGWGLHGGIWGSQAEGFPDRQVLAPDLPGYGVTPSVSPYDSESLAAAMSAAMPAECTVVGWSLGGMVALAWAARRPEQVRALVLVGTSPVFVRRPDWPHALDADVMAEFGRSLAEDHRATLLRFLSLQARSGEAGRTVLARLRADAFAQGGPAPATLRAGFDLLHEVDLRVLVQRIRCPVLVIHGGRDTVCPPSAAEWLTGRLPNARLILQAKAGHAPFLSHPEWFTATLRDFLDETGVCLGAGV